MNFLLKKTKSTIVHNDVVYSFYRTKNIFSLKKIWNKTVDLLQDGIYFTYQYNMFCAKLFFIQNFLHKILNKKDRSLLFILGISEDNKVLIFPGVVDNAQKKIYLLGEQYSTGAGYNDVIGTYDENMWEVFLKYLNSNIENTEGYTLSLNDLTEKTAISPKETARPCVKIHIKNSNIFENESNSLYDLWYASMSKNSRQNLRTAYNRMITDNVVYEMKSFDVLSTTDALKLFKLILKRSNQINLVDEKKNQNKIICFLRDLYKMFFSISFYMLKHSKRSKAIVLYLNGKLSACMITYSERTGVIVPKLAFDTEFSRYSPGCVMISEFIKRIKNSKKDFVLDLSRGDERYKVALGGEIYYNYRCDILLK